VSEDTGGTPPPYVLDVSVVVAVARGDTEIMTFIQHLDGAGRSMVIPVLAITAASLDARSEEADELLEGLELLDSVEIAPVQGAEQAAALATVIARTDLDPWDAHVAAVADADVCPILTLDAVKWRQPSAALDDPLHIIEIADPDEAAGGRSAGAG
jgi:uncharacterized protein with PIN domain